jgi:hypothetical protein
LPKVPIGAIWGRRNSAGRQLSFTNVGTMVIYAPANNGGMTMDAGDVVEILEKDGLLDYGVFQIRAVGPLTDAETLGGLPSLSSNQAAIFHVFEESRDANDIVKANIYKASSESSKFCPLACSVRNNEVICDSISIMHPNAARVVSLGFNSAVFCGDGYEIHIRAGVGCGRHREITLANLN